ncbi:MAG: uracil-DNA glycosylase [Lysobacterales bacterium]
MSDTIISDSWDRHLASEFDEPYMGKLREFLKTEKAAKKTLFPPSSQVFEALKLTPLEHTRVVILGQDPYHGPGQAHGLSFSVPPGIPIPPSLKNIFKEIESDLGIPMPAHGHLSHWARQGVLLLNSVLTVEQGNAGAHQGQGWETFTDAVVTRLDQACSGLVFMLWGSYAQKKGQLISRERHQVLESAHPSPLSAHRGFLGCRHFSLANDYLATHAKPPIDWSLPEEPQ